MEWWMWIVGGILCLGLEVAQPGGFVLLFFGLAGFVVGGTSAAALTPHLWQQAILEVGLSALGIVLFRRRLVSKTPPSGKLHMDTLVGEVATARERIAPGAVGKVELRGTVWTGHNPSEAPIADGQRCRIVRVEGLTVWLEGI